MKTSNIKNGTDLANSWEEIVPIERYLVAHRLLFPLVGSKIYAIGSKYGMSSVILKNIFLDKNDSRVMITVEYRKNAQQTGELFDMMDCTDF